MLGIPLIQSEDGRVWWSLLLAQIEKSTYESKFQGKASQEVPPQSRPKHLGRNGHFSKKLMLMGSSAHPQHSTPLAAAARQIPHRTRNWTSHPIFHHNARPARKPRSRDLPSGQKQTLERRDAADGRRHGLNSVRPRSAGPDEKLECPRGCYERRSGGLCNSVVGATSAG